MSKQKPISTKAGIVLSAAAYKKLQQLADWMETRLDRTIVTPVTLSYTGCIVYSTERKVTFVSPLGALVQMFKPFKLKDARGNFLVGLLGIHTSLVHARVIEILGISHADLKKLINYMYRTGLSFPRVIEALRNLK